MNTVRLGFIGMGTVGAGVVQVLRRNHDLIVNRTGMEFSVTSICVRDINRDRGFDSDGIEWTTDPFAVTSNDNVDIVVELMGGVDYACEVAMSALNHGKHIVSANKALFAERGNEVLELAAKKGLQVAFEGGVAGGIPILEIIKEGMVGNKINHIAGIINGTSNYILTQMKDQGWSFDDALKKAQELGYAEADPTLDINGGDAAHKLSILATIAFGMPLVGDDLYKSGIEEMTAKDVLMAEELGYVIKLLGVAKRHDDGVELRVHPTLLSKHSPLSGIEGVLNAVQVSGDAVGPIMTSGAGAGGEATASAVIADLVKVARGIGCKPEATVPPLGHQPQAIKEQRLLPPEEFHCGHYLRLTVENVAGVMASITNILADEGVSIQSIVQKDSDLADGSEERLTSVVLLTEPCAEAKIGQVLLKVGELPSVHDKVIHIRVEQF